MNPTWNRWIPIDSGRLAPYRTKAGNDSVPLRIAQEVEARRVAGSVMWKNAFIVKIRGDSVLVRYAGRQQEFDEWIPFSPDHLAPCGDHLQMRRTFVDQRRRLLINTSGKELEKKRPRIFVQGSSSFGSGSGQTNPRFLQYQNALRQNGLDLVSVEGDGNCLFRSISHQVYGDDKYHTLVRASCMDYMESEKEYFQPFVIGDMTHFIRYLNHKRQNGIWGDDPELQAMCELYDRPAEVYAYDPVHGYRKLRTFHENSTTLARNRPPIRLSYYGGGHYDSIVATDHLNNIIR
jgi:OTU domain-containing protein 5